MSVLRDLYFGKLRPADRAASGNPDYTKTVKAIIEEEKALRKRNGNCSRKCRPPMPR